MKQLKVANIGEAIKVLNWVRIKKPHIPIIEKVVFGPKVAYATDLEVWLTVPIQTRGTGQFCISPDYLGDLATVVIKPVGEKQVRVEHKGGHILKPAEKVEDYPPQPKKFTKQATFIVQSELLREAIADVMYSVAKDESRPVLAGILFELASDSLTVTSADGFRLTTRTIPVKVVKSEEKVSAIVTKKAACIMSKLGEEVTVSFGYKGEDKISVGSAEGPKAKLDFMCIQGIFPNYRHVIPEGYGIKATVDSKELAVALRAITADQGITRVKTGRGKLEVRGQDDETVVTNILKCKNEGTGRIAFKQDYLLPLTKQGEKITIKWNAADKPFAVQTDRGDYVIMPMFVPWCDEDKTKEAPPNSIGYVDKD